MFTVSPSIVICKFTKGLSKCKVRTYHEHFNDVRDKMFKISSLLKKFILLKLSA